MSENRLPDYLDPLQQAAADARSFDQWRSMGTESLIQAIETKTGRRTAPLMRGGDRKSATFWERRDQRL